MFSLSLRLVAFLALAAASGACGSDGPLAPGEQRELERAKNLWSSRGLTSYVYETRTLCFCPPAISVWTQVTVRNDTVISAVALTQLPSAGQLPLTAWPTVTRLFEVVE